MTPKPAIAMLLAITAMLVTPLSARDNRDDRDFQWLFREHHGDGTQTPTAVFLSWNYSSVIFRASCEKDCGSINLAYYPEDVVGQRTPNGLLIASSFEPMGFERGNKSKYAKVRENGDTVEATFKIDDALLDILAPGSQELTIIAANPEGDPWYVGQAAPLYQLAKACR